MRSRFTSLGFTLRRTYRKISTAKPSVLVVAIFLMALSIFILGGGVYDLLQGPFLAIPFGTRLLYYFPGTLQDQFGLESFVVMTSYLVGVIGILLMYQSTKYAYKPRQAFILLLVGAVLILIAYVNIENLILAKLTTGIPRG